MKVVHIVENLNRGAVENWLVRMLRFGVERGAALDWTFYCVLGEEGTLDATARSLGARVIHTPVPIARKAEFLRVLRGEFRDGRYDVVHCHHDLLSGVYLVAACGLPIRRRLVHVHNADELLPTPNGVKQSVLRPLLRGTCLALADRVVGISQHALDTFLAGRLRRQGKDVVHYYGIDPAPFQAAKADRVHFRRELNLADDARILLFAARMVADKNPLFAVEVLAEMHRRDPAVAGVFVGSGALEEALCARAADLGVANAFRQLGWRSDIAEVMSCCDWFILPHVERPKEGLGVAILEAQLAGLRLLLSQGILDDPLLPSAAYARLPLAMGPAAWADAAFQLYDKCEPSRAAAACALRQSAFSMDTALSHLMALHDGA